MLDAKIITYHVYAVDALGQTEALEEKVKKVTLNNLV